MATAADHVADAQPAGPAGDSARLGWAGGMRRALAFGVGDAGTIAVALAGFLLRGGLLLLLLPSSVMPSVIGIAGIVGMDAFGIDGRPTPWLYQMSAIASVLVAVWLVVSFVVGSLIDFWLIDAALGKGPRATRQRQPLPDLHVLLDLAAVRSVCVLPLVGAVVWAGPRLYDAIYNELTLPTSLATPLAVCVIQNAAVPVAVVVLTWLASEVVGAIAVRRLLLLHQGVWWSIGGAMVQLVRRPISSASTVVVSFGTSVVAMGVAMAATALAFDWCRLAARNQQPISITIGVSPLATTRDFRLVVFILAVVALVIAWTAALALSGIASAWRSAAFTAETAAAAAEAHAGPAKTGLGLSAQVPERFGD